MIARLKLEKFGKFSGRTLEFSPFTIVTGPNEAGKTTVFDALFDNLCVGGRNDLAYKRLRERYGKDRRASLEWAAGAERSRYDAYEFLDIFAIRGGQVHIDAEEDGAWFRAFKSALFTAGIDPAELSAQLFEAGREAKNKPFVKRLAAAGEEISRLREVLRAETQRRQAVLAGEDEIKQLSSRVQALRERAAAGEAALAGVRPKYEAARAGRELDRARKALVSLHELETLESRAKDLGDYSEGALGVYDALSSVTDKKKEELALLRGQLKEKERAAAAAAAASEAARSAGAALRAQGEQAALLKTEIEKFFAAAGKAVKISVYWPLRFTVWGAGLALAAGLCFWLKGAAGAIVAVVVAALAGAVGWFAAAKNVTGVIEQHENLALIARLTDAWRNAGLDAALVRRDTVQGMLDALSTALANSGAAKENALKSEAASALAEREKGDSSKKTAAAEEALRDSEAAGLKWLAENGCRSRDEYSAKAAERLKNGSDVLRGKELALDLAKGRGCEPGELKYLLQDEAERLERAGAALSVADGEMKVLETDFERRRGEAQELKEELLRAEADLESRKKVAATKLEGIPETLNRLAVELAAREEEAADIRLMLEGYKLAAGIFETIAGNSALKLNLLAGEVGAMLARLLPDRAVEFTAFDMAGAAMKDAGGGMMPLGALSSGTRDLFMLAARLALARKTKSVPGGVLPALLLLDEPFYTLDPARTLAAIKLLDAFRAETGWQVIVLTKDPAVAEAAKAVSAGVSCVEL